MRTITGVQLVPTSGISWTLDGSFCLTHPPDAVHPISSRSELFARVRQVIDELERDAILMAEIEARESVAPYTFSGCEI